MLHSWRSIGTAVHRVHSHDNKDEHERVNEHIPCRLSFRLEPDKSLVRVSQDEQQNPYTTSVKQTVLYRFVNTTNKYAIHLQGQRQRCKVSSRLLAVPWCCGTLSPYREEQ